MQVFAKFQEFSFFFLGHIMVINIELELKIVNGICKATLFVKYISAKNFTGIKLYYILFQINITYPFLMHPRATEAAWRWPQLSLSFGVELACPWISDKTFLEGMFISAVLLPKLKLHSKDSSSHATFLKWRLILHRLIE